MTEKKYAKVHIGYVALMSNIISNAIIFEIFSSEHEYLCVRVYRVLVRFTGSKLVLVT
jgi:hypothetical protein